MPDSQPEGSNWDTTDKSGYPCPASGTWVSRPAQHPPSINVYPFRYLAFATAFLFSCIFRPENACQAPNSTNPLSIKYIRRQ